VYCPARKTGICYNKKKYLCHFFNTKLSKLLLIDLLTKMDASQIPDPSSPVDVKSEASGDSQINQTLKEPTSHCTEKFIFSMNAPYITIDIQSNKPSKNHSKEIKSINVE
jgi:hypothetical protein